jgi:hypothetical protein
MPLQPARNIASAEAIERLATVRALPKLIIGNPPNKIRGRTHPATKRKTAVRATITPGTGFGFVSTASYNSLKNALTPLLDRIGARPYCEHAISTPKARLPMMPALFAPCQRQIRLVLRSASVAPDL